MSKSKAKSKSEAKRIEIMTGVKNTLIGYTVVIPDEFAMGKDPVSKKKAVSMGLGANTFFYPVAEPVFMPIAHYEHLVGCGVPFMAKCEVTPVFEQTEVEIVKTEDISPVLPEATQPEQTPVMDELEAAEAEADEAAVDTAETSMQTE